MNRDQKGAFGPGSSHQPGPMVVGQEQGQLVPIRPTNPGPKGPDEPGPMAHVARPAPWAHEPGPMPPLVPVLD